MTLSLLILGFNTDTLPLRHTADGQHPYCNLAQPPTRDATGVFPAVALLVRCQGLVEIDEQIVENVRRSFTQRHSAPTPHSHTFGT